MTTSDHCGAHRVSAGLARLCLVFALVSMSTAVRSAPLDDRSVACQTCHGIADWQIKDPVARRTVFLSIETSAYQRSSHGSLGCHACHDPGYDGMPPHRGTRGNPLYLCVLCHQDDPELASLHLPERMADLKKSVHGNTDAGRLDCHTCHDPHTFRPVNDSDDALRRIERSNGICLNCHGPLAARRSRFDQPDAGSAHPSLPNYDNHLRKVKCIACHTVDAASTHHDVTSKDRAVSDCSECHAQDSPILDIVYGPRGAPQETSLVDDAYVIGSARSPRLERLSVVIFLALLGAISLHALARIVYTLKKRG